MCYIATPLKTHILRACNSLMQILYLCGGFSSRLYFWVCGVGVAMHLHHFFCPFFLIFFIFSDLLATRQNKNPCKSTTYRVFGVSGKGIEPLFRQ